VRTVALALAFAAVSYAPARAQNVIEELNGRRLGTADEVAG
jgi:hypothetical protein